MHGSRILYLFDVAIFSLQVLMNYWWAHIVNDLSAIDGVLIGLMAAVASFSFLKLIQYVFFFFKDACAGRVFSIQTAMALLFPAWISCSIAVLCYADPDEYSALMSLVTVFLLFLQ